MSINEIERIVIRHVSGSKANQIEQIPFVNLTEITIGRDPSSNIAFDSPRDDIVSRRHAVIRVVRGDQISFRLADLGIPRSRQYPKILWIDDAEVVGDVTKASPVLGDFVAQEIERGVRELSACGVAFVVRYIPVHETP